MELSIGCRNLRVLGLGLLVISCHSGPQNAVYTVMPSPATVSSAKDAVNKENASPDDSEQSIWMGMAGGVRICWSTVEIYVDNKKFLSPLVNQEFEGFRSELAKDTRPGEKVMACDYSHSFSIASIVGKLVSLDDRFGIVCGKPSVGERFITVDLTTLISAGHKIGHGYSGSYRFAKLTDYFNKRDVLLAMLSNPMIIQAFRVEAAHDPTSLEELASFFEQHPFSIKVKGNFFSLPGDFLNQFAFDSVDENLVHVKVLLKPGSEAEHALHAELELLLPIPKSLETPLNLAASRKEGFLMKDEEVSGGRVSTFHFKTP